MTASLKFCPGYSSGNKHDRDTSFHFWLQLTLTVYVLILNLNVHDIQNGRYEAIRKINSGQNSNFSKREFPEGTRALLRKAPCKFRARN